MIERDLAYCDLDPRVPCESAPREQGDNLKKDTGKDPWHLAPWDAFLCIVRVMAFGARKYSPRCWEQGMAYSRLYSALMRHLTAWWQRNGVDPDTGYSHLWHAGCCVCFLIAYELRGIGEDDRPEAVRVVPAIWAPTAVVRINEGHALGTVKGTE